MQQTKSEASSTVEPGDAAIVVDETADLVLGLRDVVRRSRGQSGVVHSLDRGAFALLAQLSDSDEVRGTALAHHACLDASTVSRHLRVLEEAGYVSRRPDPADARAALIAVTRAGRDLVTQAIAERTATFAAATAHWSPQDRATLTRLVRRLADDLENT
jgi:DNA-binding MarR family transcriptional regulator